MEPNSKENINPGDHEENLFFVTVCPVCNSKTFLPRLHLRDHSISKENFEIVTCANCSFVITNPRPQDSKLSVYYQSDEYISHSATRRGLINKLYHAVQKFNLSLKYKAISKYVPRGTWMDYGAGNGAFLAYLKNKTIPVEGFEPDENARTIGAQKGITIHDSASYSEKKMEYAGITMWHVLEHIPNLNEVIKLHHQHLLSDGILTVAVPNHLSFDARFYKEHWAAYDVPRHLWHFSERNMIELITKNGFEYIKTSPLVFDSYYVSMLSEKYKNGFMIRGAIIGMLSNFYARVSGYPFSSQIYIFRKKSE